MEVEDVVDAPLFDIRASHSTHVLAHYDALIDSLEVRPAIHVHHSYLWIEGHG